MKTADRITPMKTQTALPPQLSKQSTARSRFKFRRAAALALLAALLTLWAAPDAFAANYTWDAGNTANGATIDPASGNWNTTAGNLVWNDAGVNKVWSANTAIFGGADGAVDSYVITVDAPMTATGLTFNNTGYKITGSTLAPGGVITVASGKTATINSTLTLAAYNHAIAGTLYLGGGDWWR